MFLAVVHQKRGYLSSTEYEHYITSCTARRTVDYLVRQARHFKASFFEKEIFIAPSSRAPGLTLHIRSQLGLLNLALLLRGTRLHENRVPASKRCIQLLLSDCCLCSRALVFGILRYRVRMLRVTTRFACFQWKPDMSLTGCEDLENHRWRTAARMNVFENLKTLRKCKRGLHAENSTENVPNKVVLSINY